MELHLSISKSLLALALAPLVVACAGVPSVPPPLRAEPGEAPEVVLVWAGRGECERVDGSGRWRRAPAFDYDFTVEQRRYADRWESVKTMRRLHPDYDGSAGPREQVLWFHLDWGLADAARVAVRDGEGAAGDVRGAVTSGLGPGTITSDGEFRRARIELHPDISERAPFDTFRITQTYRYEDGRLDETVELLDHDGAREVPWVRNVERAALFTATRLPGPPTSR